ncbi:hypothetical protein [Bradyrhizobium sp. 930_D9_N1_4]|uniref:hypothetical protein n=1 Tax=Bradyrhizobium sp. 930_D9_N1_4 TaxID=3240374 RepID=UPI003F8A12CE
MSRACKGDCLINLRAFAIATCVGAMFFGVGYLWNVQPDLFNPDEIWSMFQSEHRKARAAVSRMLIEPHSAHFNGLHTVEADSARYVCGVVKAANKTGHSIDAAFVYTVAIDFARVDDGGQITSQHSAYKSCPNAGNDGIARQQPPASPGAMAAIQTVGKMIPPSGGGTMEQQLGQLATQTGQMAAQTAIVAPGSGRLPGPASAGPAPAGQPSGPEAKAAPDNELTWRADQPPSAWPALPSGQCLAKSTHQRTASEALAFAKAVETHREQSKALEASTKRVLLDEIKEARCALVTIDPADKAYPQAWGSFVRLRAIDRELAG